MRSSIILLLVMFALCGCRELVQDEFDAFGPFPVLNGVLYADSVITVHVSLSQELNENQLPMVDNALVVITEDSLVWDTLSYVDGRYISSMVAKASHHYWIEATVPSVGAVNSHCFVPALPRYLGATHIDEAGVDEESVAYPGVDIQFATSQNKEEYFELAVQICRYDPYFATIHSFTDPVLLFEGDFGFMEPSEVVFSNQIINNSNYTVRLHYSSHSNYIDAHGVPYMDLHPLKIVMRSVSKDYFLYQKSRYMYEICVYPMFNFTAQSTFDLYSNVNNGYGIFAGASSFVSDTIFPTNYSNN